MSKNYLKKRFQESNLQKSNNIKICSFLILIVLFSFSLNAQTPQGIGKFKIKEYTLDSLFSEYKFSVLKNSKNNYLEVYDIIYFGGSENYEIIWDGNDAFYLSENIDNQRIFSICSYSVAGLELKGLNLFFYEGILYKIQIKNKIKNLLEKLIFKYPNIEKDSTKSEKVLFQNAFGATIEKTNYSRDGNWHHDNGIKASFFDTYYYNDSGELFHMEHISIYNSEISDRIFEMEKIILKGRIETKQKKLEEEILKSDL